MYLAVRGEERYTVFLDHGKNLPDLAEVSPSKIGRQLRCGKGKY